MDDKAPKLSFGPIGPIEIIDPDSCPVLFGDVVVEYRPVNGMVYLSLGAIISDGDAQVKTVAKVTARLRISLDAVNTITRLISAPPNEAAPEGTKLN